MPHSDTPKKHKLNDPQWFALCAIADEIIPPSTKYNVPGAGDRQICKEILSDVDARLPQLIETLDAINALAREAHGNDLGELPPAAREQVATAYREAHPRAAERLAMWTMQCYYRDDRVLASLGMDARPPFPQGYDVESGDWSELDLVRAREPLFREAP